MKFRVLALATLFVCLCTADHFAQDLYKPRNVKAAYAAGLRSKDGKPTAKYFQNSSAHNIKISVNPPSRYVSGSQEIVYKNNSPLTLDRLIVRLEMNAHAPESARERNVDTKQLTSDVVITEFAENGVVRPWKPLLDIKGMSLNA
ncbi:MAG TPA: hypothetical protein DDW24_13255, partial [Blastocatellia bacterium]|nr:hypothetical protein [Blastocatellia bacterium]